MARLRLWNIFWFYHSFMAGGGGDVQIFFHIFHQARSPASFEFYSIVHAEKIPVCIYAHLHAMLLYFGPVLNIQLNPSQ